MKQPTEYPFFDWNLTALRSVLRSRFLLPCLRSTEEPSWPDRLTKGSGTLHGHTSGVVQHLSLPHTSLVLATEFPQCGLTQLWPPEGIKGRVFSSHSPQVWQTHLIVFLCVWHEWLLRFHDISFNFTEAWEVWCFNALFLFTESLFFIFYKNALTHLPLRKPAHYSYKKKGQQQTIFNY